MVDRGKVVNGLTECIHLYEYPDDWDSAGCVVCPYRPNGKGTCNTTIPIQLLKDALELLKEQEPRKPIYNEQKYGSHLPHCGNCEKVLPNNAVYGKVNFCHYCGRAVKWE